MSSTQNEAKKIWIINAQFDLRRFASELAVARNHPTGVKDVVQPAVRAADQYSARIQCRKTPVIIAGRDSRRSTFQTPPSGHDAVLNPVGVIDFDFFGNANAIDASAMITRTWRLWPKTIPILVGRCDPLPGVQGRAEDAKADRLLGTSC